MRAIRRSLYAVASGVTPPVVVNDWGFNFRAAASYVTDGPNEVVFNNGASFIYPSTYVHANLDPNCDAGWTLNNSTDRDRDAGVDRRLAGMGFRSGLDVRWRCDVSTALARLSFAFGDASNPQNGQFFLFDGDPDTGVLLDTYTFTTGTAQWSAGDGNVYDEAGWVAANDGLAARVQYSVSAGFITLQYDAASGGNNPLTHIRVEEIQ